MGFYSFEDLRERELMEKSDKTDVISGEMEAEYAKKRADFIKNLPENQDILEQNEAKTELESYIFDPKNRSKVDDLVVEARKLKHNICDWNYDFLGKYRVEAVEAERLKAVLEDYILLVGLLEKGGK